MKLSMILSVVLLSLNAFAGGGGTGDKVCPGGVVVGPWAPCPGQSAQSFRCEFPSGPVTIVKFGITTFKGHPEDDFVVGKVYSEKIFPDYTYSRASTLGEIVSSSVAILTSTSPNLKLKIDVKTGILSGSVRGHSIYQKGVCAEQN